MSDIHAHAFLVTGTVQGVGFRAYTRHACHQSGLTGWVRNRPDGAVEGVLQGPEDAVHAMLQLLRSGPPHATVQTLEHKRIETATFHSFEILRAPV